MDPFVRLDAAAVPIEGVDIDTDQIVPARFMHKPRVDYGRYFFHDLRFDADGALRPGFVLNRPDYAGARILVGDTNFGCGSSREQAVHTLADYGIRALIAPSFGDIFHANCFKNGVLPIVLEPAAVAAIRAQITATPGAHVAIDLQGCTVTGPDGAVHGFAVDPFRRECLLGGLDEIDYTLTLGHHIAAFEAAGPALSGKNP